jgi:hypothetical protein
MPVAVLPAYNYEKEQEPTVPEPSKEAGLSLSQDELFENYRIIKNYLTMV